MVEKPDGPIAAPAGACYMADKVSKYILEMADNPDVRDELFEKYLADFRAERPLVEIARELGDLGFAEANDVAYVEDLPKGTQHMLSASIKWFLERKDRWTIQFAHEPADGFSVRVNEDEENRVATFVLLGPHH